MLKIKALQYYRYWKAIKRDDLYKKSTDISNQWEIEKKISYVFDAKLDFWGSYIYTILMVDVQ